jgi:hypothetical protein
MSLGGDSRTALVWNFEDDNYTWMDAGAVVPGEDGNDLAGAVCMQYGFQASWQTRWEDAKATGIVPETWAEALAAEKLWTDYYDQGREEDMYFAAASEGVWQMDQVIDASGEGKAYYVERVAIDMDDLIPEWTTNQLKHIRQFYFHMKSTGLSRVDPVDDENAFEFQVGWSQNLMDLPGWDPLIRVPIRGTDVGGRYKVDYRTTGRYLSLYLGFRKTDRVSITGGDMDAEQSYGR